MGKVPTFHDVMCVMGIGTGVSRPESGSPALLASFTGPCARDNDDHREARNG
jgi:hypothetical protein